MTVPDNRARTPEGLTSNVPFVSAHTRAVFVVVLFAAYILLALFSLASNVLIFITNPVILEAEEGVNERLTLYELLQGLAGLGTVVVFIALVVAFLMWLHRASRNLRALGNPSQRIEFTPGWAVGWFFVPFANLVMPYKAVREVWEKSDPAVRTEDDYLFAQPSSAPLLLGWWVMFLAANVTGNLSGRMLEGAQTDAVLRSTAVVDLIASNPRHRRCRARRHGRARHRPASGRARAPRRIRPPDAPAAAHLQAAAPGRSRATPRRGRADAFALRPGLNAVRLRG